MAGIEAYKIREFLVKKFRPDDIIAAAEAGRRLNDVSIKKHEDPANFVSRIGSN
jgi:hypothetical protein